MERLYHLEAFVETWVDLPGVDIHAFQTLPSTQDYLWPIARKQPLRPVLCVADEQTQGRGRGSKSWQAPIGAALCFSLCIRMDKPLHELGGLTLAYGVALCEALGRLGAQGLGLKWPNDIYGAAGKLAGILTEVYADPMGATYAVVGVGVNIDVPSDAMLGVDTPWTDLRACGLVAKQSQPFAKEILVPLVKSLLAANALYEHEGFAAFHAAYDALDCLKGKRVRLEVEQKRVDATVLGVSDSGELSIDEPPFKLLSAVFL